MATNNFIIPEIIVGQAQKEVTHNEALAYIDAFMKNPIISENTTAPPAAPILGEIHTVGVGALGAFTGMDGKLAAYINNLWVFITPWVGLSFWSIPTNNFIIFDGTIWVAQEGAATAWGGITGTLSSQVDLQNALDLKAATTYVDAQDALKENSLNNPLANGQLLSSTIAGVRTWIDPPTSSSAAPDVWLEHTAATGVGGGSTTVGNFQPANLNSLIYTTTGLTFAQLVPLGRIVLPAGTWYIEAQHTLRQSGQSAMHLYDFTTATSFAFGWGGACFQAAQEIQTGAEAVYVSDGVGGIQPFMISTTALAAFGLGTPKSIAGYTENYGFFKAWQIA